MTIIAFTCWNAVFRCACHYCNGMVQDQWSTQTIQLQFTECGFNKTFLNAICWGTGLQIAITVADKTAAEAKRAFALGWVRHYGWPEL